MSGWLQRLWPKRAPIRDPQPPPDAPVCILNARDRGWGDYGHVLTAGITGHLPRENGLLQMERTGPFIPPITFPGIGDIVVTDDFRQQLESSGLTGFTFRPVKKALIVRLDWQEWKQTKGDPPVFPESGEPEDYVLGQPHSEEASRQMGDLWEVCLQPCAQVERVKNSRSLTGPDLYFVLASWDATDLFRADGVGYNYASRRAKDWFEGTVGEWVTFTWPLIR